MFACTHCRPLLLDHLYGLLEADEAAAIETHLTGCPECATAFTEAARWQGLIARAAKHTTSDITFAPPAEPITPPTVVAQPALPTPSVNPLDEVETSRKTVPQVWVRWVVAASLFLAFATFGGPAIRDTIGYHAYRPVVMQQLTSLETALADHNTVQTEYVNAKMETEKKLVSATKTHDAFLDQWMTKQHAAHLNTKERPAYAVNVRGPASAVPGAPNNYIVQVMDRSPKGQSAEVKAEVRDKAGKVHFTKPLAVGKSDGEKLELPPNLWAALHPGEELYLHVVAVEGANAKPAPITEPIRLAEPVYTTFLTTDRPMYRPGEVVYFRSLTLDRTRFLPPQHDVNLKFELRDHSGKLVPNCQIIGQAKPAVIGSDGQASLVRGPDGLAIRGVGLGAFQLPKDLAGTELTLNVYETPLNGFDVRPGTKPLATRKILVQHYNPDHLLKKLEFDGRSFGPGDVVSAKLTVHDQGRPVENANLTIRADADRQAIPFENPSAKTDAKGEATIRFKLPATTPEIREARLAVTITTPTIVESIVRPVPLATRTLTIEFFPEGGDLIASVPNRVYFRATTSHGKPADVQGVLTDGLRTLATIQTLTDPDHPGANQGLGVFTFTPEPGHRYAVRLNRPLGIIQPPLGLLANPLAALVGTGSSSHAVGYELPVAKPQGVMLTVPNGVTSPGEPIPVTVANVGTDRKLLVGAYVRGVSVAHHRIAMKAGETARFALDPGATKLGGVTRITVFEELDDANEPDELQPLAERLVFRRPGERLNLQLDVKNGSGEPQQGPFLPGSSVRLDIMATNEVNAPQPAILWAAVVNQSVHTMADDKSARLMPTHFLLNGEVRKPDELEHADFFLLDHPKAAESLDLLLGTQGWRRFAEQAPHKLRERVPAEDADRLLVAMGGTGPVPLTWRDNVRTLFNSYWPQYEATLHELEATRAQHERMQFHPEWQNRLAQAQIRHQQANTEFGDAVYHIEPFDNDMQHRRYWLPVSLVFLIGGAGLCLILRHTIPTRYKLRKPMLNTAVGLILLAALLITAVAITGTQNERWRVLARSAPLPERYYPWQPWTRPTPLPPPVVQVQQDVPEVPTVQQLPVKPKAIRPRVANPFADPQLLRGVNEEILPDGAIRQTGNLDHPSVKWQQQQASLQPKYWLARQRVVDAARVIERATLTNPPQTLNAKPTPFVESVQLLAATTIPHQSPFVVREYAHARPTSEGETRIDFTETLVWKPVLVTPQDGKLNFSFDLSDAVAPYQILVAGHTLDGRIGAVSKLIEVRKPFAVSTKIPAEIGAGDILELPVMVTNATGGEQTSTLSIAPTGVTIHEGPAERYLTVPARIGTRTTVRVKPTTTPNTATIRIQGKTNSGHTDSIQHSFAVVPSGFPYSGSQSDVLKRHLTNTVKVPQNLVPGTLELTATLYPSTLSELQSGLDGLMREPRGCFEQASTANYPNVLISRYLQETHQQNPELARRSLELMDRGYRQLLNYECQKPDSPKREGYDWFGGSAAPHEALTAYGLLQFTDMARVYPVDADMLQRTRAFLVNSQDGEGGFRRNEKAVDQFGRAPEHITNAYIVWAISEAERGAHHRSPLTRELDAILATANGSGEAASVPYFLGLVANALLNRKREADALPLLNQLVSLQASNGSIPGAKTSITRSAGRDLLIETTALTALAWIQVARSERFTEPTRNAMAWLTQQRGNLGTFGSTQSTILAMKALIAYSHVSKRPAESGEIRVIINGVPMVSQSYSSRVSGPIVVTIPNPEQHIREGKIELLIGTTGTESFPLTLSWECRTLTPPSSPDCPLRLATSIENTKLTEGDVTRLSVVMENLSDEEHGMAVAIVGIPAGLKIPDDRKQLRELTTRPADDGETSLSYWETRGRELILYWRGLAPKQRITLPIDVIADIPGEFTAPASRAYLYYHSDPKQWIAPVRVTITPHGK